MSMKYFSGFEISNLVGRGPARDAQLLIMACEGDPNVYLKKSNMQLKISICQLDPFIKTHSYSYVLILAACRR